MARGVLPGRISAETAEPPLHRVRIRPATDWCLRPRLGVPRSTRAGDRKLRPSRTGIVRSALVLDVSNACLGLLNGMVLLADMIELGHVRAVWSSGPKRAAAWSKGPSTHCCRRRSYEAGRETRLRVADNRLGLGPAILLCDRKLSRTGHRLLGRRLQADTASHERCSGGVAPAHGDDRPRMQNRFRRPAARRRRTGRATPGAKQDARSAGRMTTIRRRSPIRSAAHRRLLYDRLELDLARDFRRSSFLETPGRGPAAHGRDGHRTRTIQPGDNVALLGIGSGLNALMLGVEW